MGTLNINVIFSAGTVVDPLYDAAGPPWTGLETNTTAIENFHNSGTDIEGNNFINKSILSTKINANAVISGKVANDAVIERAMADNCVGNAELLESVAVPPNNPDGPIYEKHINWASMTSGRLVRVEGTGGTYTMGRAYVSPINFGANLTMNGTVLWAAFTDGDPSLNTPAHAAHKVFTELNVRTFGNQRIYSTAKINGAGTGVDWRVTRCTNSPAATVDLYIYVFGKP